MVFDLLRIAIGRQQSLAKPPSQEEWQEVFDQAQAQGLLGVCFAALRRLPAEVRPAGALYSQWLSAAVDIQQRNELLDRKCGSLSLRFERDGFKACVLKGQPVATLYGELAALRQSGDIDIWLWPTEDGEGMRLQDRRCRILEYVKGLKVICREVSYPHIELLLKQEVLLELHFTPSFLYSPFRNARLQRWLEAQASGAFAHKVCVGDKAVSAPDQMFNLVTMALHVLHHLLFEGIGLRQVMDYYFVLVQRELDQKEREDLLLRFKDFGITRLVRALMWILKEQFGMEDRFCLCPPDAREGQFLLSEILRSGNFGQADDRMARSGEGSKLQDFCLRTKRNLHFVRHYPSEVLWCPLWKIWHQIWLRSYK